MKTVSENLKIGNTSKIKLKNVLDILERKDQAL